MEEVSVMNTETFYVNAATMSSGQRLRELINERLTAAAEEIFRGFQTTISEYEAEINRQRRLLDTVFNPELKLHRTELPQQHVCKEEEVLTEQQLCDQERNSHLDPEEPEPPQIKEEQEELCTSLEEEQLVLKQETETWMWTPTCEESEDQTLDWSPDETQIAAEEEHVVSMSVQTVQNSVEPEPDSEDQLLSHNSHVAESQDHKGDQHGDSGSTRNVKPEPQERHHNNEDKSTTVKSRSYSVTGKKSFKCDTCGKCFVSKPCLNIHMRVHTGENLHTCNTCERRFSKMSALKVHKRVHTGERPHTCNTCGKGFSYVKTLKIHMNTHTGDFTT